MSGKIVQSAFSPPSWLRNPHLQTILPSMPLAWTRPVALRREILILPDGDETAVDWASSGDQTDKPLLVILHGLEGSARSSYAQMLMSAALQAGFETCVLNFRDCGDYRNKLPRRYHAGETADVAFFIDQQRARRSGPIVAAGFSLGGNVLLKYLGEEPRRERLAAAVGVCVPLDLQVCADALKVGGSRIYQRYMIGNMKKAMRGKFSEETAPFDWRRAEAALTFDEFDDAVTAPLHGFAGKDDYYGRCSSRQYLRNIDTPTLVVNALDDPFMGESMLPEERELSGQVTLELSQHGGHVGFIEGGRPGQWHYFLPQRVMRFLLPRI